MPQYLLSVHTAQGQPRAPMSEEEMRQSWSGSASSRRR